MRIVVFLTLLFLTFPLHIFIESMVGTPGFPWAMFFTRILA